MVDFFFLRFYLFIHERHTERGRGVGRGRSRLLTGNLMWDSIPRPGSRPGQKADAQPLSHPGIPVVDYFELEGLEMGKRGRGLEMGLG